MLKDNIYKEAMKIEAEKQKKKETFPFFSDAGLEIEVKKDGQAVTKSRSR